MRRVSAAAVVPLHSVFSSVPVIQSVQSDLGITLNAGAVSAWADQSGAGKHYSQGTGAAQPTFNSSALNGLPTLSFNGTSHYLTSTLNLPAPGTTPTTLLMVVKDVAWASTSWIVGPGDGSIAMTLHETVATPSISQYNGSDVNASSGATVGSWARLYTIWTNSTSDKFKAGSAAVATGANAGNTAPGSGRVIAGRSTGLSLAKIDLAALIYLGGVPTAGELSAFDAAVTAKYGAGVLV